MLRLIYKELEDYERSLSPLLGISMSVLARHDLLIPTILILNYLLYRQIVIIF